MTGLDALLADCDARGIRLRPSGDGELTLDAPQAVVTPQLLNELRQHKGELLVLLRGDFGCRSDFSRLVAEMMDRVCHAMPADCELTEQDWRRLDTIHEKIISARRLGELEALVQAANDYEDTAHLLFSQ